MLNPRDTPQFTRAADQFAPGFWGKYVRAYLSGGADDFLGDASAVLAAEVCSRMRVLLSQEALQTPVLFTERLSNQVIAICFDQRDGSRFIAINSRFKADPEILAHTLVEEFAHAQQMLDGVDFEAQQEQFAYAERPYERQAKQIATQVLGYEPEAYQAYIKRDELSGLLYDRPTAA